MEKGPIFIGGLSYSGKTYLRLMLMAHPNLMVTRRTKMWTRYYGRFGDLASSGNFERCLSVMLDSRSIQALEPDPDRLRAEFRAGPPTYGHLFGLFHAHHAEQAGKPRWGDQLGRVEAYAEPIFAAYPAARMIHMVRDPRTRTAASLANSRRRRARLGWETAAWRHSARLASYNARWYPDRYLVIRYEELLGQPEVTLRRVCAFIEEPYTPAMLAVEGVPELAPASSANGHGDQETSLANSRELALLQAGAGREMRLFYYPPHPLQLSAEDYLLLPLVDWPLSLAGKALWWATEGKRARVN